MRLTNFLLAGILAVLVVQFMPRFTLAIAIISGISLVAYVGYWALVLRPKENVERKQQVALDAVFWQWDAKHKAIRAKYDPSNKWNEATQVPEAYKAEQRVLNNEYREMLITRNGWTEQDFA